MPVAFRKRVKKFFPNALIDIEVTLLDDKRWIQTWFIFDPISARLLSLGCKDATAAWKEADKNAEKILAQVDKAKTKTTSPILPRRATSHS